MDMVPTNPPISWIADDIYDRVDHGSQPVNGVGWYVSLKTG